MGTFRASSSVFRSLGLATVLVAGLAFAACGGSTTSSSTTTQAPPTSAPPPSPSTVPATVQAPCSALASALAMSELHPKNTGNWNAEKQRIVTDTASNVELFAIAKNGVPAEVATALETLQGYSKWLGTTMSNAPTFDAAVSAVNAYPDLVGASLATSIVDNWKRTNC